MAGCSQVQWYCCDHTNTEPFKILFNTAAQEKEDFLCLNDRLADLFGKLEKERSNPDTGNEKYIRTIQCLQDEIKKMRACYEAELAKVRHDLAITTGEKCEMQAIAERLRTSNHVLSHKVDDEMKQNDMNRNQIADLKCQLTQKENEANELTKYVVCLKSTISLMQPKLEKYEKDAEIFAQQYDCERKMRQDFEDKNVQLVDKVNFDARQHDQQMRDMEDRVQNLQRIIDDLNAKIRELMHNSGRPNLNELLQKIREQLQEEFEAYRCEVTDTMKRTLAEMRARLEKRICEKQRLEEEKDHLEEQVAKLQGQLNQTLHELDAANQCNKQLQTFISHQKANLTTEIRNLEGKLLETEDSLMHKVREVAASREVQTGLRIELDSLKTMIVGEEDRVNAKCLPPVPCNPAPVYATQGFPNRNVGCRPSSNASFPTVASIGCLETSHVKKCNQAVNSSPVDGSLTAAPSIHTSIGVAEETAHDSTSSKRLTAIPQPQHSVVGALVFVFYVAMVTNC